MFKKLNLLFVATALMLISTQLIAAPKPAPVWIDLDPASPGFTYSVFPADEIKFFNGNIMNQSSANIESVIETQFALTNDLTPVAQCDTNCVGSFSSLLAFNYLAIHFGKAELLFFWDDPINQFSISSISAIVTNGGGLSNYRAYSDGLSEVPLPAAGWLFGSALIGLMGLRRKMH